MVVVFTRENGGGSARRGRRRRGLSFFVICHYCHIGGGGRGGGRGLFSLVNQPQRRIRPIRNTRNRPKPGGGVVVLLLLLYLTVVLVGSLAAVMPLASGCTGAPGVRSKQDDEGRTTASLTLSPARREWKTALALVCSFPRFIISHLVAQRMQRLAASRISGVLYG